ncbi:MAG: cell surface protein [Candidatus Hydrogenedentota bacterium]
MHRSILTRCLAICLAAGVGVFAEDAPTYLSPGLLVMDAPQDLLYVGAQTANKVLVFDLAGQNVAREIPLDAAPTGLALASDGATLLATLAGAPGSIAVIDAEAGDVVQVIEAGHTPMAPVLSHDDKTLYIANRFDDAVARIDMATGEADWTVDVDREPVAAALTPDGAFLFVANHLPSGASDGKYSSASVSVIDTGAGEVVKELALGNGSASLRDVCIAPDGEFVYVTHIVGRYQLPTTQLERGWMNTNALTVIDAASQEIVNTVLLDSVDLGAANPWAVACTEDGEYLVVTHAGTHEISVIDRSALHDKLERVARGEEVSPVSKKPEDVPNDLSFLVDLRRRIELTGNGPRGLALDGTKAYAGEYFSDTLCVVDIKAQGRPHPESIALGNTAVMTPERLGERHFNDARLCFQHWQSCVSCHPGGRADALNWDLLNDGMGNPKNTKSLLLSHETPPVMITGVRPDAETAVRAGIKHIQFAVRPEEDAQAIDAYLKSMTPVPSPLLVAGELSAQARRGKRVYEKAGCAHCHSGKYHTDQALYDVGTGRGREENIKLDTPSLVEVWRTAPYLHDGRAATIRDVLTTCNPDDRHGKTSALAERALDALVEYVMSL